MADKTRVSYHKDMRAEAKAEGKGLLTVSMTMPNGERLEEQMVAGVDECRFAKWMMVALFCEEVKSLPDVQQIIRRAIDEQERQAAVAGMAVAKVRGRDVSVDADGV